MGKKAKKTSHTTILKIPTQNSLIFLLSFLILKTGYRKKKNRDKLSGSQTYYRETRYHDRYKEACI